MINIDDIDPISCDPRYADMLRMINQRIVDLKFQNRKLELSNEALQKRLDDLKPIIKDVHYKPAKSKE